MSPHEALRHYFGFSAFRPGQETALNHVLAGRDTLVVMPTGAGKSLIYQIAALLLPHVTLVISPLVALMKDQIDSLTRRNVPATCLHSGLDPQELNQRLQALSAGAYKIVLVAPERLRNAAFRQAIEPLTVGLLAVDEAHCLSQWGHDFRPDYLHIAEARQELRIPQVLALTATATPRVQDDIVALLGLPAAERLVTGFNRPNLTFDVQPASSVAAKRAALQTVLRGVGGACLVYAGTRRDTEEVAAYVQSRLGLPAQYYHGGLEPLQREATQNAFVRGDLSILVATNAFGMGIDRPDVRLVLHYSLPGTLEAYYQEAGRAGRDGQPARALLLYGKQDVGLQEFFIENDSPSLANLRAVYNLIERSPGMRAEMIGVAANLHQVKARVALAQLEAIGALRRRYGAQGIEALGLQEEALHGVAAQVATRRQYKYEQLRRMVHYATGKTCRRRMILDHFGDPGAADAPLCCDYCTLSKRPMPVPPPAATSPPLSASEAREALARVAYYALAVQQSSLIQFAQGVAMQDVLSDATKAPPEAIAKLSIAEIDGTINRLLRDGYLQRTTGDTPLLQLVPQVEPVALAPAAPPPQAARVAAPRRPPPPVRGSAAISGQMLMAGRTPEQVASERGIALGTVYAHLSELIGAGQLDIGTVVPVALQTLIHAAIAEVGQVGYMAPIKALLPAEVSYEAIRCVIAAYKWERRHPPAPAPAVSHPPLSDLPIASLRRWRQQQAEALGQPDWALFAEGTLQHLARQRPQALADLRQTPGLSAAVQETYGPAILTAVAAATSSEMVDAILACVRALPGTLPRSGVAKLLVGSQSRRMEKLQTHPLFNCLATYTRRDVLLQVDMLLEMGLLRSDERGYVVLATGQAG